MKEEFLKIINHYGVGTQLKKLSEQVYCLQEAVLLDEGDLNSLYNILDKYIEVEILLRQIGEYFELSTKDKIEATVTKISEQLKGIE